MIENLAEIGGQRLAPDEEFRFACGPHLACFNTCCRNKRLPLWPYDLLRLRRALDLPSGAILEQYAELEFDPASGWPALRLRLDDAGRCPFVSQQGCSVYEHRPAACRIYPLARMAAPDQGRGGAKVVYVRQDTQGCLGWDQPRTHTAASWDQDQGLNPYHQANDQLLPLLFHPRRKGKLELTPPQIHAVIAALYNLDIFRQMVDQPKITNEFGENRVRDALDSDEELLLLGRDFLSKRLFGA